MTHWGIFVNLSFFDVFRASSCQEGVELDVQDRTGQIRAAHKDTRRKDKEDKLTDHMTAWLTPGPLLS